MSGLILGKMLTEAKVFSLSKGKHNQNLVISQRISYEIRDGNTTELDIS